MNANQQRILHGGAALRAGSPAFSSDEIKSDAVDTITSILHFCDSEAISDIEGILRSAAQHFESERDPAPDREEREFHVEWVIDLTACSPREAAEQALMVQRRVSSIATVFTVEGERIDLEEEPDDQWSTMDPRVVRGIAARAIEENKISAEALRELLRENA